MLCGQSMVFQAVDRPIEDKTIANKEGGCDLTKGCETPMLSDAKPPFVPLAEQPRRCFIRRFRQLDK